MNDPTKIDKKHDPHTDSPASKTEISTVFQQYQSSLSRYIARFLPKAHDIEDIVHDTFLHTYEAQIKTHIRSPKAYLFRTARNLALKQLTKMSSRLTDYMEDCELSEVLLDNASLEEQAESQQKFAIFCEAVRRLPLQCRRVYILRKVYGFSHKEIAKHLDISVSTIEKHLAKGIIKCDEHLRANGY